MKILLIVIFAALIGCGPNYCPSYSTYEYNKDIVKAKSYRAIDAKMKRKAKKYNAR